MIQEVQPRTSQPAVYICLITPQKKKHCCRNCFPKCLTFAFAFTTEAEADFVSEK